VATTPTQNAGVYRRMLLDKRKAVLSALGAKTMSLTKTDRVGEEDQAQHSHEEFVSLRLNRLDYLLLRQVQEALDRLGTGDYGLCLSCEEPIPGKRLKALPWARYCFRCQEQLANDSYSESLDLPLPSSDSL
jgi:RNA polymerase-binding transcription factor